MDYTQTYDKDLEYSGWSEYLPNKKRDLKLFNRKIIGLGKEAKEKWRRIVEGKALNKGAIDCAYCRHFRAPLEEDGCPGCPIEFFTKGGHCLGTPYYDYLRTPTTNNAKAMKDFVDEVFIRSLLLLNLKEEKNDKP